MIPTRLEFHRRQRAAAVGGGRGRQRGASDGSHGARSAVGGLSRPLGRARARFRRQAAAVTTREHPEPATHTPSTHTDVYPKPPTHTTNQKSKKQKQSHDPLWPRGKKPPRLAPSPLAWIPSVLKLHEDEVMRVAGMDAVAYIRLLQYGWTVFAFATVVCCVILFPVYGTGGVVGVLMKGGAETISDLDVVSLSNVPSGSPRMVAQLLVLYVVAWFALMLLLWYSRDISGLRARFMSTLPRGGPSHTVLYTDVPGVKHGTLGANPVVSKLAANPVTDKVAALAKSRGGAAASTAGAAADAEKGASVAELPAEVLDPWLDAEASLARDPAGGVESLVRRECAATYGAGEVAAVHAVYDTQKLDALVRQYDATKAKLEGVYEGYAVSLRAGKPIKKRKTVSVLPTAPQWAKQKYGVGAKPVKVDALEYLPQQLEFLKKEIDAAAPAARGSDAPRLPAAFVTFNSRKTATVAATSLHALDETCWRAQPAPGSDEIVWRNLGLRHWQVVVRTLLMFLAFVGLLLLYLPVTAFVQAFVNLDNVSKVPGLGTIARLPFVTQILKGILPSLVLKIFLALLPPVLAAMARFSGAKSVSRVDLSVVANFFVFQVFAVFLYQTIGGSGVSQLQQIIANPSVLVKMLGVSIPQQASFFMSFIAIGAAAAGGALLRIVGLAIFCIKLKLFGTERARYGAWKPEAQVALYGTSLPNHTIVLLLGLTFCCISPLIAPFCLLYFTSALVAQKYSQVYVVTHPYEAQGQLWTNVRCFSKAGTPFFCFLFILPPPFPPSLPFLGGNERQGTHTRRARERRRKGARAAPPLTKKTPSPPVPPPPPLQQNPANQNNTKTVLQPNHDVHLLHDRRQHRDRARESVPLDPLCPPAAGRRHRPPRHLALALQAALVAHVAQGGG